MSNTVSQIKHLYFEQLETLKWLTQQDFTSPEIEEAYTWYLDEGHKYMRSIISCLDNIRATQAAGQIATGYINMLHVLSEESNKLEGSQRSIRALHQAEWIVDTPERLALRLRKYGVRVAD